MYRPNAVDNGRVSLVQANDIVRAITASPALSTTSTMVSGFAPPSARMTKQPVRVLARPPPPAGGRSGRVSATGYATNPPVSGNWQQSYHHNHGQHGVNPSSTITARPYSDLVEIAEQQRRQIDANRREEERRQAVLSRGTGAAAGHHPTDKNELTCRVRNLRREVAEEELELKRLSELERETRALRARNDASTTQSEMLARSVQEEQAQLRKAAAKVDGLKAQLEELHRRRRAAANAALIEQKRMNTAQAHSAQMAALRAAAAATPTPSGHSMSHDGHANRPRASVEPFQIQQLKNDELSPNTAKKDREDFNESDSRVLRSHPSVPMDDQRATTTIYQQTTIETDTIGPTRQDISPSPPKDPHPTVASPSSSTTVPVNSAQGPVIVKIRKPSMEDMAEEHSRVRGGKTDLVSIRNDSLKATKRRSWAASEGTTFGEAENILRILSQEQRKGNSRFIPSLSVPQESSEETTKKDDDHSSVCFSASLPANVAVCAGFPSSTTMTPSVSSSAIPSSSSSTSSSSGAFSSEPSTIAPSIPSFTLARPTFIGGEHKPIEESSSPNESVVSESSLSFNEEKTIEIVHSSPPKAIKGILRNKDTPSKGRRIQFDPLALLLDAALEGEIDLVKESAGKLSDVSESNDEGITALHNGICAGHYQIVRFLIDANADVNAQDSDGWTPLHCAASCNNLPMVRILVEGGACVLASTLSDVETPVEKCEEEEAGYDGCLRYLIAAHNATGTANGGMVYAAYPYSAERDDELTFEGGDKLRVIEKDSQCENGWWKCEKIGEDGSVSVGLAPRTYLSLYPPLKYRQKLAFVPFDFTLESNNNDKEK